MIGGRVFLQQEAGQFLAQQAGHVFAFAEGDELLLVRFGKHTLERLPRTQQPTLTQSFPSLPMQKWPTFHGSTPKTGLETQSAVEKLCYPEKPGAETGMHPKDTSPLQAVCAAGIMEAVRNHFQSSKVCEL
jgi:hypothetical protein